MEVNESSLKAPVFHRKQLLMYINIKTTERFTEYINIMI